MSLKIFQASAGSGKTYTLSKEYIKLLLKSGKSGYYQHILTVTFTNNAAKEMKNRVLKFLYSLKEGDKDSLDLLDTLSDDLNISKEKIKDESGRIFNHLLHHYGFFNILTIDSFFQNVVQSFSREMNISLHYQIEMDTELVSEQLVDHLFDSVNEDDRLKQWLVDFSMENLYYEKSYDIRRSLIEFSGQLFKDSFKNKAEGFFSADVKEKTRTLINRIEKVSVEFENTLQEHGKHFFEILKNKGLETNELKGGKRSPAISFFTKLKNRQYKDLIKTTIVNLCDGAGSWTTKTSAKKDLIIQLAEDQLIPLLKEIIGYFEGHKIQYFTAKVIQQNQYTLGILSDLSENLQQYRNTHEVLMISDLSDFLKKIIRDNDTNDTNDTPFIYEKIGSWYQHFLIDEFQDTSATQWNNFKPLIKESAAKNLDNLIVGDPKQSIYAFRGGDPSLLLEGVEKDMKKFMTVSKPPLDKNYRSCEFLIQFNNDLFSTLPSLFCELVDDTLTDEGKKKIIHAYEGVKQEPKKKTKGRVCLEFHKENKEVKWKESMIQETILLVEDLQKKGYPLSDIAILVRKNDEAQQLVDGFLNHKSSKNAKTDLKYDIVSEEAMVLEKVQVINLLILAMNYLITPTDKMIEKELVTKYLTLEKPTKISHDTFTKINIRCLLPKDFIDCSNHLTHLPVYELVEVLVRVFDLTKQKKSYAYLQAFQDLVLEYTLKYQDNLMSFLEWWHKKNLSNSRPILKLTGSLDAVQVLTIHKSKGLEFPIVIVPFCNFDMDSRIHTSWYPIPKDAPFQLLELFETLPVPYKKDLENTIFSEAYKIEKANGYLESLNSLYVAFTRAEKALYVFCEEKENNTTSLSHNVSTLLMKYFENSKSEGWNMTDKVFSLGILDSYESKNDDTENKNPISLDSYPSYKWTNRMKEREDVAEDCSSKMVFGKLFHEILSKIEYKDQANQVLDNYERMEKIIPKDREFFDAQFKKLWENEKISSWFHRGQEVKTEIELFTGEGKIKRMDRVIIKNNKVTVVDFKTGNENENDKKQVKEYMDFLKQMNYIEVTGYLLYLKPLKVILL